MPTTPLDLSALAASADLPPVAVDVLDSLIEIVGDKLPVPDASTNDVAAARTAVADALRRLADGIGDYRRRTHEATLLALTSATLAESHRLDQEQRHQPCLAAHRLVRELLRAHRRELRPRVRRVLLAVVDGVATEDGRGAFVGEVRSILEFARRWKATSLDVDASMALRLGGMICGYRASRELRHGDRYLGTVTLAPTNAEGRLILLIADGRAPESAPASVVSRVRSALRKATHGVVDLDRDERGRMRFVPPLELTSRAKHVAQAVRSLHLRPRAKSLRADARSERKALSKVMRSPAKAR